jgi:hypothetical protein
LKLIFLIVTRAASVLGLSRREAWWKDAEILMLRHQLAVALRERASRPFEVDVAGPGVAGPARRTSACWKSSAAYWPHTRRRVSVAFGNKTLATSRMPRVTTAAGRPPRS